MSDIATGPLKGIKVIELAGVGPGPFCAMLLADMGADVIRIDRVGIDHSDYTPNPVLERGRRSIALDLKSYDGRAILMKMLAQADVLIESYRPGVAERLGIGPDDVSEINDRLIYGRLSGWGQTGPMSGIAGHDINYIGLTGTLYSIGREVDDPVPPLNLVGDFGGGAYSLALGIACALIERGQSGVGQVIDASVFDGTGTLMALVHGLRAQGRWDRTRGTNLLDTGCPYYDVYPCADGKWIAIGTIEEKFFRNTIRLLGLEEEDWVLRSHKERELWPRLRSTLKREFERKTRDEWVEVFGNHDTCVTPVLDLDEAIAHEHANARQAYVEISGRPGSAQPAVAPRYSRSKSNVPEPSVAPGTHTREILDSLDFTGTDIEMFIAKGVAQAQ